MVSVRELAHCPLRPHPTDLTNPQKTKHTFKIYCSSSKELLHGGQGCPVKNSTPLQRGLNTGSMRLLFFCFAPSPPTEPARAVQFGPSRHSAPGATPRARFRCTPGHPCEGERGGRRHKASRDGGMHVVSFLSCHGKWSSPNPFGAMFQWNMLARWVPGGIWRRHPRWGGG